MKLRMILALLIVVAAVSAQAGDLVKLSDPRTVGAWKGNEQSAVSIDKNTDELASRIAAVAAGTTLGVGSVGSAAILNGSVAPADVAEGIVVSPTGYAGTGVKIQFGSIYTNSDGTAIAFAEPFTALPTVTLCPEAATTNIWYISALTISNFVVHSETGVAGGYMAIGLK